MQAGNIATSASLRKSLIGWFSREDIDCLQVCDPFRVQQLIRPSEQQHQLITTLTSCTVWRRNGTLLFWGLQNLSPSSVLPCIALRWLKRAEFTHFPWIKDCTQALVGMVRRSNFLCTFFSISRQMQTQMLMISKLEVVTKGKGREMPSEGCERATQMSWWISFSLCDLRFRGCETEVVVMRKVNMSGCRVEYL